MDAVPLNLTLSPHGRLILRNDGDAAGLDAGFADCLRKATERGSGHGLLLLGADEVGTALPAVYAYWRDFGAQYVTALCTQQEGDAPRKSVQAPTADELERMVPYPVLGTQLRHSPSGALSAQRRPATGHALV